MVLLDAVWQTCSASRGWRAAELRASNMGTLLSSSQLCLHAAGCAAESRGQPMGTARSRAGSGIARGLGAMSPGQGAAAAGAPARAAAGFSSHGVASLVDTPPAKARHADSAFHGGLPRQVLQSDPSFSPLAAGAAFGSPVPLAGSSTRPKVQHSPPPKQQVLPYAAATPATQGPAQVTQAAAAWPA